MIWRTDKPKGSPIVVYRNGNPLPEVLFLATKPYPHYYDDCGEEIPDGMIQKWASLEESSLPSNLDEAAEEYVKTTSVKVWGRIDPKKDLKSYMARANYGTGLLDGFKAGAEWMIEKFMAILKEYREKGLRCMLQSEEHNEPYYQKFWDGFQNCALNIKREMEKE